MKRGMRLQPEDRRFFELIGQLIFSNPFSTEQAEVRAALGDQVRFGEGPFDHALTGIDPLLRERLARLAQSGLKRIEQVSGGDRRLLGYAFLFDIYHAHAKAFDQLIQRQLRTDDQSVAVPFADELIARLRERGFVDQEVARYIALFYQFRRGFYFIARELVGDATCMKQLRQALWNAIFTHDVRIYGEQLWDRMEDFSILLLGPTGAGKGTAAAAIGRARLIHFDLSTRRFLGSFTRGLVATNLSEFPESLIESELFGHRKGAFTGAIDHHQGLLQRCQRHGALFLDEIGEVAPQVQIKLLNVLQDRRFTAVGSHETQRFSGRVIAATNRTLAELLGEGRFRLDFFYRLSSSIITLPSLRERLDQQPEELDRLVSLLLGRMIGSPDDALCKRITDRLRADLPQGYAWPGNVRELEQAMRRILLGGGYQPFEMVSEQSDWQRRLAEGDLTMAEVQCHYCRQLYRQLGSYERVGQKLGLDRRTVRKYLGQGG